jgi:hypothetical protein
MSEISIYYSGAGGVADLITKINCGGTLYTTKRRWTDNHYAYILSGSPRYGYRTDGTLNLPTSSLNSPSDVDQAVNETATKARAGVKSGKAGGWESVAELHKTIDMLRHPFASLTKLTNSFQSKSSLRRGSSKGLGAAGSDILQFSAGEWLKYRYGVLPLINDVQAVLNELGRKYVAQRQSSRASVTLSNTSYTPFSTTVTGWGCSHVEERESQTKVRAVSLDEYRSSMAIEAGLDLSQIPKTAWDLIPYSFVVDWFINVGDFLNAMTPRLDVNHLGGCVTVEDLTITRVFSVGSTPPTGHVTVTAPEGSFVEIRRTKTRTVPLPEAALLIKSNFRFDKTTRVGDAAALIGQKLARMSLR